MAKRIKEKAAKIAQIREKRPHAIVRHVRISPYKIRVVLKNIRNKSVNEALNILHSTPKSASPVLIKLINSAVANAEHNLDISRIDLFIAEIFADGGPTLKRAMPRARGRSDRIFKRTSHITVILDSVKNIKAEEVKKEPTKVEKVESAPKTEVKPKQTTAKTTTAKKQTETKTSTAKTTKPAEKKTQTETKTKTVKADTKTEVK